jgi:hypothetical protein
VLGRKPEKMRINSMLWQIIGNEDFRLLCRNPAS